jgi:putative SOS response-associated peptidase YedK
MCGRFTLTSPRQAIEQRFGVDLSGVQLTAAPRYNVAPSEEVLAIAIGKEGDRRAIPMRWGLIPSWSRDGKQRGSTINARIESATTSSMYRDSFRRWRCLIPADGFYEWREVGKAGTRKPDKVPYWITREDHDLFAFAGLYSVWRAKPEDPWLLSCSIITTPASDLIAPVHDRMPLILEPDRWDAWIDRELQDASAARELLAPSPTPLLLQPVSRLVNSPNNDGPELVREVQP